ncbi:MAG TPA: ABC transporter substrate-binding protein [Firmicutes bacterium]|nr:ABC transporter substrate-binding protein [Bacillota bacterium]
MAEAGTDAHAWGRGAAGSKVVLRLGYFPNITHAQAVLGVADGTFARALGPGVELQTKVFNAGPSVIEALFAGELDLSYVGPNPAVNGYVRSRGEALRIIAGATSGGAALVVREGSGIRTAADFHGKRLATPQLGNTQDVAARAWLLKQGYRLRAQGGDVEVLPLKNPDQLALFQKGEIDAAWTVEPWATRLIREGGGRLFLDERDLWPGGRFVTAHVIVSTRFLARHPGIVRRFLRAHVALTQRINARPAEARKRVNGELRRLTGQALPGAVLADAFSRLEVTWDPVSASLFQAADQAYVLGFLGKEKPRLAGIYCLEPLNAVLAEKHLPPVQGPAGGEGGDRRGE